MAALARFKRSVEDAIQRVPGERIVWRGPSDVKRVALTFDDGPDDRTPRDLDVLERYGVAATFFVMGDLSEARPGAIAEYLRRGHQVGSHGYDHKRFTQISPLELRRQIVKTAAAIGPVPQGRMWIRPPYGAMGPFEAAMMLAMGRRWLGDRVMTPDKVRRLDIAPSQLGGTLEDRLRGRRLQIERHLAFSRGLNVRAQGRLVRREDDDARSTS